MCIIKEIVAFWTKISKEKDVLVFMKTLTEWLIEHCESVILLLLMNAAMDSLAIHLGLKLLNSCIFIYFQSLLIANFICIK